MQTPPKTIEDALTILLKILDKETMEIFASRSKEELKYYHCTAGVLIRKQFELTEGNDQLIESCQEFSGQYDLDGERASIVILEELWKRIKQKVH
jgi:hypothetical protein